MLIAEQAWKFYMALLTLHIKTGQASLSYPVYNVMYYKSKRWSKL